MMLYVDTSALVKLYVEEPRSAELIAAVDQADAVATSQFAFVWKHGRHSPAPGVRPAYRLMLIVRSWRRSLGIGCATSRWKSRIVWSTRRGILPHAAGCAGMMPCVWPPR